MADNVIIIEETPVIQASMSNATYRGAAGTTPVKGVDYFTESDIEELKAEIGGGASFTEISNMDILHLFNNLGN